MSNKFWSWYMFFFLYIFPLIFSYVGTWKWSAWPATLSLAAGMIGWIWFLIFLYKKFEMKPNALLKEALWLQKNGKPTDAKITEIITRKEIKDGTVVMEIKVELSNLANEQITTTIELYDTKPHLKRFEVGQKVPLRLNTKKDAQLPWIFNDGSVSKRNLSGRRLIVFTIIYAVVTFIIHYQLFSNGQGWRWVTLYHPWVFTPYLGILFFGIFSSTGSLFGGGSKTNHLNELLLHGLKTTGSITKSNQTGLFVNEQPQIKYTIRYTDNNGKTHHVEKKDIVLLTELHRFEAGEIKLLYLPSKPTEIIMI